MTLRCGESAVRAVTYAGQGRSPQLGVPPKDSVFNESLEWDTPYEPAPTAADNEPPPAPVGEENPSLAA